MPKIKKNELPGLDAQLLLAPEFRKKSLKNSFDLSSAKKAGVLILCYPDSHGVIHFVLILRKAYKGVHSAQVAFPGGKLEDQDKNLTETAIRETEEEIGVNSNRINVIRPMTELYIPPSNFLVKPTLASIDYTPEFVKEDAEVDKIIQVNFNEFLDTPITKDKITTSYTGERDVMCYKLNGYTVWGATAMMLSELQVVFNKL